MDDYTSLKIRSDLYSHKAPPSPMANHTETTGQLSNHDNNRNIIEDNTTDCDQAKNSKSPKSPKDWSPDDPCFVCTGMKPEESENKCSDKEHPETDSQRGDASPLISIDVTSSPQSGYHSSASPHENPGPPGTLPADTEHRGSSEDGASPGASLDLSTNRKSNHVSPRSQSASPVQFQPYQLFAQKTDSEVDQPFVPSLYPGNLPPQLIPWLISSQIQNFVNYQNQLDPSSTLKESAKSGLYEDKEQPLDLSAKKSSMQNLTEEELTNKVLEFKSSARGRKRADSNKKNYTEDELQAALKDILRGKLGTRKAAVHYGIPRSTLRNKMQKLTAMDKEKDKRLLDKSDKPLTHSPDSTRQFQDVIRADPSLPGIVEPSYSVLKTIIRSRMNDKLEELSRNTRLYLSGGDMQKFLDTTMSHLLDKIPELALNIDNRKTPAEVISSLALYPQLQEFTNRIVEERFNEEILRVKSKLNGPLLSQPVSEFQPIKLESPLNIPSYSPSLSYNVNNNNETLDKKNLSASQFYGFNQPRCNFKDVLTQIINHKMVNDEISVDQPSDITAPPTLLPLPVQNLNMSYPNPLFKLQHEKPNPEPSKKRAKSPSNSGGKGSRPKRGKYRNYDRAKLLKAVEAVQTGEMSVHRAGTHYGVPHSTLEYKVKERHLHRDKKKPKLASQPLPMNPPSPILNASAPRTLATRPEIPDTTTMDYQNKDSSSDDISVIGIRPNPPKRSHPGDDRDLSPPATTTASNPFLHNPFSFWNAPASLIPPFLPRPYSQDSLYASPFMKSFGEQSLLSGLQSSVLNRDSVLKENRDPPSKPVLSEPAPPPPSSGLSSLHESFFNNLLRRKMEAQIAEGTISNEAALQQLQDTNDVKERNETPTSHSSPIDINQFLPSFLVARSSIAAALCSSTDRAQADTEDNQEAQTAALTLVNESSA